MTCAQAVTAILQFLDDAKGWISAIPPVKQSQRFGNTAFRSWLQKLTQNTDAFHRQLLPESIVTAGATTELAVYLHESFGNSQRIDYGSGHELNFVCWLTALNKIGILNRETDHTALGLSVIPKCVLLSRSLARSFHRISFSLVYQSLNHLLSAGGGGGVMACDGMWWW